MYKDTNQRYQAAKKITLIGIVANVFLGLMKLTGGFFYRSHALVADGIHSFSDLLIDSMVLFASKYGNLDADDSHPYGHQRIETAATLLLALLLIFTGLGIAWDSLYEMLYSPHKYPTHIGAFAIAILSILINEVLFHYTKSVGKKINSFLILANAWHHRSDAASSAVVALGLLAGLLGFPYMDTLAAIIVGLMITKMGINYGWSSVKELVDTAVDEKTLKQIEAFLNDFEGIKKIHQLRSRSMGQQDILIDLHILVDPYISVSEGHYIAQNVHYALIKTFTSIKDVTVHVDPEDDEKSCPSRQLPCRSRLEKELFLPWQQDFPNLNAWVLHYLGGAISIDLYHQLTEEKLKPLQERIKADLKDWPQITHIGFFIGPRGFI